MTERIRMLKVLSLGAGVQSSTVLLMSCVGELPKLDCAVFADTQWEPPRVYRHLEWLKIYAEEKEIPVHTVTAGPLREHGLASQVRGRKTDGVRWASMPLYTIQEGAGKKKGQIKRQCTKEYKIQPIDAFLRRELLGLKPRQRAPREPVVEQWFGISADEASRMKAPRAAWKTHFYPLCGLRIYADGRTASGSDLERTFRRSDCLEWLRERGFPQPPRSACVACPYHSNEEWRRIRADPELWRDATEFDRAIRDRGMRGKMYVHRSCRPLELVDLSTPKERGQGSLFEEECEGYCGL